ncbi:hypothetical protein HK102_012353, partial [Quaeritorhiza haematococci]
MTTTTTTTTATKFDDYMYYFVREDLRLDDSRLSQRSSWGGDPSRHSMQQQVPSSFTSSHTEKAASASKTLPRLQLTGTDVEFLFDLIELGDGEAAVSECMEGAGLRLDRVDVLIVPPRHNLWTPIGGGSPEMELEACTVSVETGGDSPKSQLDTHLRVSPSVIIDINTTSRLSSTSTSEQTFAQDFLRKIAASDSSESAESD